MILVDTHVMVWLRAMPDRLSPAANAAIDRADALAISDISLWELAMLVHKGRLQPDRDTLGYLRQVAASATVLPITADVASAVATLPDDFPTRDPADRIIYATARVNEVDLVSADGGLRAFDPSVIWA